MSPTRSLIGGGSMLARRRDFETRFGRIGASPPAFDEVEEGVSKAQSSIRRLAFPKT
jgi:hypothetical protein